MSTDERRYHLVGAGNVTYVLLHGWGLERTSWEPFSSLLEPFAEVATVDLWGFGANAHEAAIPAEGSVAHSVREVIAICDELARQRIVLIGSSRGGLIALAAASKRPDLFSAVVTISVLPRVASGADYPWGVDRSAFSQIATDLERDYAGVFLATAPGLWFSDDNLGEETRSVAMKVLRRSVERTTNPSLALRILLENLDDDVRPLLPAVHAPLLALSGERDLVVPPAAGELIAATVARGTHEVLAGAGHLPQLTMPELLSRRIAHHLKTMN